LLGWSAVASFVTSILDSSVPCEFHIVTNGVLLNNEKVEWLKRQSIAVAITLDGTDHTHDLARKNCLGKGSSRQVIKAISEVNKAGIPCEVQTVLDARRPFDSGEFIDRLRELGCNRLNVYPEESFCKPTDAKEVARRLLDLFARASSSGITVSGPWLKPAVRIVTKSPRSFCSSRLQEGIHIGTDGAVYPCLRTRLRIRDSIEDCCDSPEYVRFRQRSGGAIPLCEGCDIEMACAGGCGAVVEKGKRWGSKRVSKLWCSLAKDVTKNLLTGNLSERIFQTIRIQENAV
jgi:uncharacterized protein